MSMNPFNNGSNIPSPTGGGFPPNGSAEQAERVEIAQHDSAILVAASRQVSDFSGIPSEIAAQSMPTSIRQNCTRALSHAAPAPSSRNSQHWSWILPPGKSARAMCVSWMRSW